MDQNLRNWLGRRRQWTKWMLKITKIIMVGTWSNNDFQGLAIINSSLYVISSIYFLNVNEFQN